MSQLVFVDTSVWVDSFRGRGRRAIEVLKRLIDEDRAALAVPVRLEILAGASTETFEQLSRTLAALPTFKPSDSTWTTMEKWTRTAVEAGERFGVGALLIAAVASDHSGLVWSRDRDFIRLSRLGLVQLFQP